MIYYIVGLLDAPSYKSIEKIQKYLSKKYNLYTDLPMLHVTLEVIQDPHDILLLCDSINHVINEFNAFTININGALCFDSPFKSVNLKVENNGILKKLIYMLNSGLKEKGFKVRENIEYWYPHISLANTNFALHTWSEEEYEEACLIITNDNFNKIATITEVQLWEPINDKSKMSIASFHLK